MVVVRHPRHLDGPAPRAPLAVARGLLNGLAISVLLWIVIVAAVWALWQVSG